MATAIRQFDRLNVGIEVVSTKGVLVPATRQIVGEHTFSEEQDFYRDSYPRGFRANVGGAGTIIRKGAMLEVSGDLSAQDVLWPLMTGVLGSVAPATVDTTGKTWTFTPELATGVPVVQSATTEFVRADGVTNHYYGEAGYMMTESFKFDWAFNQIAKMSWKMFGRARQTGAPTGGVVPYPTRETLASNTLVTSWDTTWAGLGGTPVAGIIRSASFECKSGYAANYTLAGRADVDMTGHKAGEITGTLNIVMEFDATAAAKFALWRSNSLVFIRLLNTGSLVGAATVLQGLQIDGAYRFVGSPSFSADGDQVTMTAQLESVLDVTSSKSLDFVVTNALAAIT
ncbi:MAG: phage tail tube protein [Chloroflexota bacterium]